MNRDTKALFFVGISVLAAAALLLVSKPFFAPVETSVKEVRSLPVSLDRDGPFLILTSPRADKAYAQAITDARSLHPQALIGSFDPLDLTEARKLVQEEKPRYAMIFLMPDELDVNVAWAWLKVTTEVDEDPFVDVRTGWMTGETPAAVTRFIQRIRDLVSRARKAPAASIDNLGPNPQAVPGTMSKTNGSIFLPAYARAFPAWDISLGVRGFTEDRLDIMDGAGFLHFGGHGYPDLIVDCLNGPWVRRLKMSPSVVFNGACYTGVTGRWFDMVDGNYKAKKVRPSTSFCLGVLANQTIAYLAALHPDHGLPVYQEMEYLAYTGASLGEVIKFTQDGVILASGGRLPALDPIKEGEKPDWSASDIMIHGTASRVLFGDPSLKLCTAFTPPPFDISIGSKTPERMTIRAAWKNPDLKSTYSDTYFGDLSQGKTDFNDRVLIEAPLPEDWTGVRSVAVTSVRAAESELPHRIVGQAVEIREGRRYLKVQIDLPASGYLESDFRQKGAFVELEAVQ